ncbi:hypothetical protein [Streptomyces sp. RKAG293]|uniref:hypothetical protein n=1 Tax=Streptomyces sp. RKAG293 TaxID=2893403 RepID=UPI00203458D7|nr:hypothetical protein [Streptomyces sp. RKAG293]MCM2422177.1 hypothetical protein [Streptomyces sp. RKAG293]
MGAVLGWLWERGRRRRALYRKADFFGVRPGEDCLIVLGSKYGTPGSAHHRDARAGIELAVLLAGLGCRVSVESGALRGSNGGRTEFCIGGPVGGANPRTGGHLAAHLPGVAIRPFGPGSDAVAITVGGRQYDFDHGVQEYVLVARFTPVESTRPVILVCGQSSVANQAAVEFLRRDYSQVAGAVGSVHRFCVLIRVGHIGTYLFHQASLERDVSVAAFGQR